MVSTAGSDGPVRLTNGKHDAEPRWSPDGKWIAFVRGSGEPPKDGKPQPSQLALLSLAGGEAWTDHRPAALGVGTRYGRRTASTSRFLCDANADDLAKKQKKDAGGEPEHESDVKVITRAIYRFNGRAISIPSTTSTSGSSTCRPSSDAKARQSSSRKASSTNRSPLSLPTAAASSSTPIRERRALLRTADNRHYVCTGRRRSSRIADQSEARRPAGRSQRYGALT